MILDKAKVTEIKRGNMLKEVLLPTCPGELRQTAEFIITMLDSLATREVVPNDSYNSMTELDKIITIMYWRTWDGLNEGTFINGLQTFTYWFQNIGTFPDLITRARRWLVNDAELLFPKPAVQRRAQEARDKWADNIAKKEGL